MMSRSSPPRYIGLVRTPAACVARRVAIASSRAAPALAAAATRAATRPRTSTRSSWVHRRGAAPPEDRANKGDVPGSATSGGGSDALSTSINEVNVSEGPGGVDPDTDATNDTDAATGDAGTPLANRGQEPGQNPA